MSCKIRKCTCVHEFQNKKYKGKRVFNKCAGKSGTQHYRCTVCGNTILVTN